MTETIEMQAGRIRSDFIDRLNKSKACFRAGMLQTIDSTVERIGGAIESGMNQRLQGEREAESRRVDLEGVLSGLRELRKDITLVRQSAEAM
ncbi:MAG: hypothetical protein ACLGPL_02970 [Acidobacteriota bacterium]